MTVKLHERSARDDCGAVEVFEDVVEASRAVARSVGDDGPERGHQDPASEPVLWAYRGAGLLSG